MVQWVIKPEIKKNSIAHAYKARKFKNNIVQFSLPELVSSVKISVPVLVMSIVCSNCADLYK
jgi:hypothetical protein